MRQQNYAPWLLDGAMKGNALRTYAEAVMVPDLHPDETMILDTLSGKTLVGGERPLGAA